MSEQSPDVTVENHGSLFVFTILTDAANEWVSENVQTEPHQWLGDHTLAVEHRYAHDIAQGMLDAGLEVE